MTALSCVPDELKALDQWVLWRYETRKGKITKCPYQASGFRARTNDPTTWTSYDSAVSAWLGNPTGFDGVGFVFSAGDSYTGIDLDACLENGQLKWWAKPIIRDFADSYMEISPSGNGIKIWIRATLGVPGTRRPYHDGFVEIYDQGRFFTVTGQVFNA